MFNIKIKSNNQNHLKRNIFLLKLPMKIINKLSNKDAYLKLLIPQQLNLQ